MPACRPGRAPPGGRPRAAGQRADKRVFYHPMAALHVLRCKWHLPFHANSVPQVASHTASQLAPSPTSMRACVCAECKMHSCKASTTPAGTAGCRLGMGAPPVLPSPEEGPPVPTQYIGRPNACERQGGRRGGAGVGRRERAARSCCARHPLSAPPHHHLQVVLQQPRQLLAGCQVRIGRLSEPGSGAQGGCT